MKDYRAFIENLLKEASAVAMHNFGKVSGVIKPGDNNQVLTETDIEIGNLIVNRVKVEYPDHNIIDEEAGVIDRRSAYTWVVDPIDGTSNFASGIPMFGIMIGLLEDGTPIAGGIALPAFGEIYSAAKGQGATCNGEKVFVTKEEQLLNSLAAYGIDGHQENPVVTRDETALLGDIILGVRNLRSSNSVFDQAMVAKGKYGTALNRTSKIWDNVAQHIVVVEAGGIYTDFFGEPMDYSDPVSKTDANFTMCAAAPVLHGQLMQIIHAR
ncbi:MAG TPA: inositol monophosphatase [Candidatus Saccharimonadales bacterium]|nr:inositol monophosphatase [Candidatus Saccharimonadales bacterium]